MHKIYFLPSFSLNTNIFTQTNNGFCSQVDTWVHVPHHNKTLHNSCPDVRMTLNHTRHLHTDLHALCALHASVLPVADCSRCFHIVTLFRIPWHLSWLPKVFRTQTHSVKTQGLRCGCARNLIQLNTLRRTVTTGNASCSDNIKMNRNSRTRDIMKTMWFHHLLYSGDNMV